METEDNIPEGHQQPEVEIYSKTAIWWFSMIFSPLFGGILLMLNLNGAGYKRGVTKVLAFTIAWFLISGMIASNIPVAPVFTSLALNITGGAILAEYFFKEYFPDKDYYPKSVVTPIIISLLIVLPLSMILYKAGMYKAGMLK